MNVNSREILNTRRVNKLGQPLSLEKKNQEVRNEMNENIKPAEEKYKILKTVNK